MRRLPTVLALFMWLAVAACDSGTQPTTEPSAEPVGDLPTVGTTTPEAVCVAPVQSPPFPAQPEGLAFPDDTWALGPLPETVDSAQLQQLLDEGLRAQGAPLGQVQAVLVVSGGRLVVEDFGRGYLPANRHDSFSIAKTVLAMAVGIAAEEGLLDPSARVDAAEWTEPDDPRKMITLEMLLEMSSGLEWEETGFGLASLLASVEGGNAAASQAVRSLVHQPGEYFEYSTGSSALAARVLADAVGPTELESWLEARIFSPIGVEVELLYDADGYWLGGLGSNMTAHDYARLALLLARGGQWGETSVVSTEWLDIMRIPGTESCEYGAGLWLGKYGPGSFSAEGFLGQTIVVAPDIDLALVVLALEPQSERIDAYAARLVDLFRS